MIILLTMNQNVLSKDILNAKYIKIMQTYTHVNLLKFLEVLINCELKQWIFPFYLNFCLTKIIKAWNQFLYYQKYKEMKYKKLYFKLTFNSCSVAYRSILKFKFTFLFFQCNKLNINLSTVEWKHNFKYSHKFVSRSTN